LKQIRRTENDGCCFFLIILIKKMKWNFVFNTTFCSLSDTMQNNPNAHKYWWRTRLTSCFFLLCFSKVGKNYSTFHYIRNSFSRRNINMMERSLSERSILFYYLTSAYNIFVSFLIGKVWLKMSLMLVFFPPQNSSSEFVSKITLRHNDYYRFMK
jgi:hypothetical protein